VLGVVEMLQDARDPGFDMLTPCAWANVLSSNGCQARPVHVARRHLVICTALTDIALQCILWGFLEQTVTSLITWAWLRDALPGDVDSASNGCGKSVITIEPQGGS